MSDDFIKTQVPTVRSMADVCREIVSNIQRWAEAIDTYKYRVIAQFDSWAVTNEGLQSLEQPDYLITGGQLRRLNWPVHVSEKTWVNMRDFLLAYDYALVVFPPERRSLDYAARTRASLAKRRALVIVALAERDGYFCRLCHREKNLTVDHIIPVSRGGTNDIRNLQLLCQPCNSGKCDRDPFGRMP